MVFTETRQEHDSNVWPKSAVCQAAVTAALWLIFTGRRRLSTNV